MGTAKGIKEQKKWETGEKLSFKQAILAKCAECMAMYADGKADCGIPECSLYPWMPYGALWVGREKKIVPPDKLKSMRGNLKRPRTDQSATQISL